MTLYCHFVVLVLCVPKPARPRAASGQAGSDYCGKVDFAVFPQKKINRLPKMVKIKETT